MMKTLLCIAACIFSFAGFGQTKLISFRSHSGSNAHFRTAVERNLFDIGNSNFGTATQTVNKIDTVLLQTKNTIIVMRKSYDVVIPLNRVSNTKYHRDTLTRINAADFFKADNIDSLKVKIRKMYRFAKLDSALFIGFDKKFKRAASKINK